MDEAERFSGYAENAFNISLDWENRVLGPVLSRIGAGARNIFPVGALNWQFDDYNWRQGSRRQVNPLLKHAMEELVESFSVAGHDLRKVCHLVFLAKE